MEQHALVPPRSSEAQTRAARTESFADWLVEQQPSADVTPPYRQAFVDLQRAVAQDSVYGLMRTWTRFKKMLMAHQRANPAEFPADMQYLVQVAWCEWHRYRECNRKPPQYRWTGISGGL